MSANRSGASRESAGEKPEARRAGEIRVEACGRGWRLARFANLEELWQKMTDDPGNLEDERLPYWTELWPSSLVLAEWLHRRREKIRGRLCLDLGCGLGLTAMIGQWLGARVVAVDYEPLALRFASRNAGQNGVAPPLWAAMDWRRPALAARSLAYVWGGDIMYEKRFARPLLRFLEHGLREGGRAWLAEPGRAVYEFFLRALHELGWRGKPVHMGRVAPEYTCGVTVEVRIWEITRGRAGDVPDG